VNETSCNTNFQNDGCVKFVEVIPRGLSLGLTILPRLDEGRTHRIVNHLLLTEKEIRNQVTNVFEAGTARIETNPQRALVLAGEVKVASMLGLVRTG